MADTVRYLMEEMVPELEDMQRKQYFSKQEIKEIVKRRQDFEYKLKRKAALKEDFLSYAEYETKLEQLRQARRRALGLANTKQTLADYALVKRVHFIFERAARKFKRDLAIWTRWLEFCRATRSNRRMSRVAARALQLHPNAPGLWTYAAAWEFEENGNPNAARALMQQGLRMCKDSRQMWLQYLDMELMFVTKLRARRKALGLDVPEAEEAGEQHHQQQQQQQGSGSGANQAGPEGQQQQAEDGEGPMEEDGARGSEGGQQGGSGSILASLQAGQGVSQRQQEQQEQQEEREAEKAAQAVLSGAVALVVVRGAVAALPRDLALRRGMLETVGRYGFPGVGRIVDHIYRGIEADFAEDPEAVDLLARFHCDPSDPSTTEEAVQAAVRRFEAAISTCASSSTQDATDAPTEAAAARRKQQQEKERAARLHQLWRLFLQFLQQRLGAVMADAAGGSEQQVQAAAAAAQQVLRALKRAHEGGAAGEDAYDLWSEVALQLRQKKLALRAAKLACDAFPISPDVWCRRVALEARLRGSGAAAAGQLLAVVKEALGCVPAHRAPEMWLQALDACKEPSELQQLSSTLVDALRGCPKGPATGGMGQVAGAVLTAVWDASGVAAARNLFKQLVAIPPAGGDMFRRMLQLEGRELEEVEGQTGGRGTKEARVAALQRVRQALEAAVDAYGDVDAGLWLAYARFEQQHAKQGAGGIYWRAVKALKDSDAFVQQYRSVVCEEADDE